FERFYREAEQEYSAAPEKLQFNEALKRMLNRFVTDLIENTRQRVDEAGVASLDEVRRWPARLAGFSANVDQERREAKQFLYQALYNAKSLQPAKKRAEALIAEVFTALMARPEMLPSSYREKAEHEPLV